ncbi:hypothetical protein KIN20_027423 [Parelaphostrongylus tenuis]|uniref:Secreted protein n=1 Tax=Parelaphostrongylus tenuis TaxID=148309 RepID=A0AAD5WDY3_PARTN|nr:hypothetical protein KIN20_027423 [Parelaphostrongylus tenuis]
MIQLFNYLVVYRFVLLAHCCCCCEKEITTTTTTTTTTTKTPNYAAAVADVEASAPNRVKFLKIRQDVQMDGLNSESLVISWRTGKCA